MIKSTQQLLVMIESVSSERDLPEDHVRGILEGALATALRKSSPEYKDAEFRVTINQTTGETTVYRRWLVIPDDAYDPPANNENATADSATAASTAAAAADASLTDAASTAAASTAAGAATASSANAAAAASSADGVAANGAAAAEPVDEFNPEAEVFVKDSAARNGGVALQVGDWIEEPMQDMGFDQRVVMYSARQFFNMRLRDAQKAQLADELKDEEMVHGTVKIVRERGDVILEVNKVDCRLPRREMIPRENLKVGDKIRALIKETVDEERGGQVVRQIILNRTAPRFLELLMRQHVPEIEKGVLEIIKAVRSPGNRAKLAVRTHDIRVDPVGTCVGIRGSRVQAVTNELDGERIDIIQWDEDEAEFVLRALSPAEVIKISVDKERQRMDVLVDADKLAQAIGKNGTNVRLATELTGWELNLITPEEYQEEQDRAANKKSEAMAAALDMESSVSRILFDEGFESLEQVAFCELSELTEIEGFGEDLAEDIRQRAKDALTKRASDHEARMDAADEHLKKLVLRCLEEADDKDSPLLYDLLLDGVSRLEDLAEMDMDELMERIEMPAPRAEQLIMAAREEMEAQGRSIFEE